MTKARVIFNNTDHEEITQLRMAHQQLFIHNRDLQGFS